MSMEPEVQKLIEKFRKKIADHEEIRKEVEPIEKTFCVDLGEEVYSFKLSHAEIVDYKPERLENAAVTITTTPENFKALVDGDLRPMRAYVTKKIKIKGKIDDLMHLKKFL